MATNIDELIEKYRNVFYLEEQNVGTIPILCGAVIQNYMGGDPIWVMLVGASSSGKTELIQCISGLPEVTQVSDLTANTFLSGMSSHEKETSLLKQIGLRGIITMKDFTTLLSKNHDEQQAIVAQMREIYDGSLVKRTGKGDAIEWGEGGKGKINFIAGVTDVIYQMEEKFSGMGTRWVNYRMEDQDRYKTSQRAYEIKPTLSEHRDELRLEFEEYIRDRIENLSATSPSVDNDTHKNIDELCDFAAIARSYIGRNYRGDINHIGDKEMPMRLASQVYSFGEVFMEMNGGELNDFYANTLYKIPFDSIPKQRRLVLETVAYYKEITSAALAVQVDYPTGPIKDTLEELTILGLVKRRKDPGGSFDFFSLHPQYRKIFNKYMGIEMSEEVLETTEDIADNQEEYDPELMKQWNQNAEEQFSQF